MRRESPAYSGSAFAWLLMLAIGISLGSGCSDPPDPVPLQKLSSLVNTADRLVVSAHGKYADTNFSPVQIKGPEKATQFLATLQFSSKRRFYHSPIHGDYRIQCFSNDQQLVAIVLPGYRPVLTWELPDSSNDGGRLKRSSLDTLLRWLATNGCDIPKREQSAEHAEKQRRLQAELNCVACFPPEVHDIFGPVPYYTDIPAWAAKRGHKLATAINDPVRLTAMSSKALGCLSEYDYFGEHEQILEAAMTTVKGPDIAKALKTIERDRAALLGASRFLFTSDNVNKLPEAERCFWIATLSEVVLTSGREDASISVFQILGKNSCPKILKLLRTVARNGTGRTYTLRGMLEFDPLPMASAYLCLAIHGDTEVKSEIENLLPTTTRPADRTALELALALLSETNHVHSENFGFTSYLMAHAARKAVERFPNEENLDALVSGSFTRDRTAWQMEETVALFESLVGKHWPATARYNGEIKQWWDANRSKFPKTGTLAE